MADLQTLLEMYVRWQQRIFPHCSFDDFIAKLEKLGSSNIVKVGDSILHSISRIRAYDSFVPNWHGRIQ